MSKLFIIFLISMCLAVHGQDTTFYDIGFLSPLDVCIKRDECSSRPNGLAAFSGEQKSCILSKYGSRPHTIERSKYLCNNGWSIVTRDIFIDPESKNIDVYELKIYQWGGLFCFKNGIIYKQGKEAFHEEVRLSRLQLQFRK